LQEKSFVVGGVKITRNCSQDELDAFVGNLSQEQKQDVKDVIRALIHAGLVSIEQA